MTGIDVLPRATQQTVVRLRWLRGVRGHLDWARLVKGVQWATVKLVGPDMPAGRTDPSGRFVVPGVQPGVYLLKVGLYGHTNLWLEIREVVVGDTDLELPITLGRRQRHAIRNRAKAAGKTVIAFLAGYGLEPVAGNR